MAKPVRPRFFKPATPAAAPRRELTLTIDRLSDEGRGIAFAEGKSFFVAGALPGETVRVRVQSEKKDYAQARLLAVEAAAPARIEPRCPRFGRCGGCQLQMLDYDGQLAHKQQVLTKLLAPFAPAWEPALTASPWHYRHRARLAVGEQNGAPVVGFREAASHRIVAVPRCEILDQRLLPLLPLLPDWLAGLKQWRRIEELLLVVDGEGRIALDWRARGGALPAADRAQLAARCEAAGIAAGEVTLRYQLPSQQSGFQFTPRDFTQVNPAIDDQLVARALNWLQADAGSRVIDLFCGLGNFTLPLARRAGSVTGVEGSAAMVERARANALAQGFANVAFSAADLFEPDADLLRGFDRALLDPPRAGARALCDLLARAPRLQRIVYVSCNPQTLARDLSILKNGGFAVQRAALVDMFPQSGHCEAMVMLARGGNT